MARKSRKNIVVEEAPKRSAMKVWQAALYIRLSVEFNSRRGDSLETQQQIMEAYLALRPDIEIKGIYTDNGITGRTFEREAFQRMLADVEAGKINCIVVKDLSRLGRNTIDTGYYIEKYFPLHGVRFIAVNDEFDSEDPENSGNYLIVPLKNMINEAYAADISRKVKAQQRQAMRDGDFVGGRPPYGYRKDPDNCHRLLVNEDTAPVVRQIFQWAVEGVSLNEIVKRLSTSGALTPGRYLASVGIITNSRLAGNGEWNSWGVSRLLADEVYVGDMVQGKTKKVGHKQVLADRTEWVVVRNTHEPLVSREVFAKVQMIREQAAAKYTQNGKRPYTPNILRGRVFCGHCGKNLHRQRNDDNYIYRCISNYRRGTGACPGDIRGLPETDLFDAIMTIIRQEVKTVQGNRLRLQGCDDKIAGQKKAVSMEISKLQQETEKNRRCLTSLLENLNTGVLTTAEYTELKAEYTQRINEATGRVQQLLERQRMLESQVERYANLADLMAAMGEDAVLSARLVEQLIERVTVNGPNDISVQFRFESGFEDVLEVLNDEQ